MKSELRDLARAQQVVPLDLIKPVGDVGAMSLGRY